MKELQTTLSSWTVCTACQGRGKKSQRLRKKIRQQYLAAVALFEKSNSQGVAPERPKAHLQICANCAGSGIIPAANPPTPDTENYPHIAIIGAGIGGVALAVACLHRGIPFTLYERDNSFDARSQGYGLTLQQAHKAMEELGIQTLTAGLVSTRHVVHSPDGKVIGEWGMRKWMESELSKGAPKRTNIHIPRQALRQALLDQLAGQQAVQWQHQLTSMETLADGKIALSFSVGELEKKVQTDLVVGADGIRSTLRRLLIPEDKAPLRYLDCMVILGICPLSALRGLESPLLDAATVFQTANGNERIYMMPFAKDSVMWQLSFPISEAAAIALSYQGAKALKAEACRRLPWHSPIPEILAATAESQISGYPVYDRALLDSSLLALAAQATLIGDAAHPMSPFKGQGANQALLDALSLARSITLGCTALSDWRTTGIRKSALSAFEAEMMERSAVKVMGSHEAVAYLHSDTVLHEGDEPRGRARKTTDCEQKTTINKTI